MKFLKKGFEYNKMAKAFNSMYVMINELEVKIDNGYASEVEQDFYMLAYICRRDMLDTMEKYKLKSGTFHFNFIMLELNPGDKPEELFKNYLG